MSFTNFVFIGLVYRNEMRVVYPNNLLHDFIAYRST